MYTISKQLRWTVLLATAVLILGFATTAYAANYHGIKVSYFAWSEAHYGNLWLSYGYIHTSQVVDQIGTTYWSTIEYCGGHPNYASFYSFNGSI